MVRNEEIYKQAVIFRKRGFTYSEIAKICGVSVSTVSNWLAQKSFSKSVAKDNAAKAAKLNKKRMMLINKARSAERTTRYADAVRTAETEYRHYKKDPLFIAGLMLYVSEGDNTHRRLLRLANSRPEIHAIFLRFAYTFLGVEKEAVRFWILLYPDLAESVCVKYWSKALQLSPTQFHKHQVISGRSKKRTLHYGVGNTIIGSTVLKYKLNRWIELALAEFGKQK